jgi:DNA-binding response OmpR family regulator
MPGERQPHILVVEDDDSVNEFLTELLRSEGYRVTAALDGSRGMACAKSPTDGPDAIVLDAMLPDLSGFEICHELKLHRETNLIPVLMLTALNDPASIRSGLRVGANRYLTKPVRPERLLAELQQAMEHRREMAERHTHTSVELHLESDRGAREQLNDLLSELFVQTPLSDQEIERIHYAALEMIDNAAEWGNRKRKDQIVTISYEVRADALRLVITDEGPGFNPQDLPHAANDDDPGAHMPVREKMGLRVGGFGIMISRGMVDEFFYNEAGNQVTLVKYFRKE